MWDIMRLSKIFKRVKWRSPSKRHQKYCPRCGSFNIKLSSRFDGWLTPEQYVCRDCGYRGPIILEIEEDATKGDDKEPKKPNSG